MSRYRGRPLERLEWGLYRDAERPGRYLLSYYPRGRGGPHVRRWAYCDGHTLKVGDLRTFLRCVRARIDARKLCIPGLASPQDALEDYVADLRRQRRSDAHVEDVRACLLRFIEQADPGDLRRLDPDAIRAFLVGVAGAARTQNKYLGHMHAWLGWCQREGLIEENPAQRVARAREARPLVRFPTVEDFTRLCDASSPYDAGLWLLLLSTGLRMGSFLSLTPDAFNASGIHVSHTKRGQEWLLRYDAGCPLWRDELTALGQALWNVRPPTSAQCRYRLRHACRRAEVSMSAHGFRHAFCSWLMMMGEHTADIAAWSHHVTAAMVERFYAHLRPRGRDRAEIARKSVVAMQSQRIKAVLAALRKR